MGISTINNYQSASFTNSKTEVKKAGKETVINSNITEEAVVVEKNQKDIKSVTYKSKVDTESIQKMKQDAEARMQQLRTLVEKLIMKQNNTYTTATDIFSMLRNGEVEVDDATREQAQLDIAKDGYWGVEQTSERLFSFAKALAGDDTEKADEMVEAFKKGYEAARKQWGGELPDICQKTYDAFMEKVDSWKNGAKEEN